MHQKNIPLFETGRFSHLMQSYIEGDKRLRPFYGLPHHIDSYAGQMKAKAAQQIDRDTLVTVLREQYSGLNPEENFPLVAEAIESLLDKNTFTVTTGHQLCLFTGPLYFIYKIVNTIRLAEELTKKYSKTVVPIFWMATEDHDFEEVNHIWFHHGKFVWEHESGDAVGRLNTDGIESVLDQLAAQAGGGQPVRDLLSVFRRCYSPGKNLATATRELVTELFGTYGLVVLDADDARLKRAMTGIFEEELKSGRAGETIRGQSTELEKHFHRQVEPRDINLFYLDNGKRYRLTRSGGKIVAVDSSLEWQTDELLQILYDQPGKFSPNVALRPLYQEVILPNLAYIGGGGELAYWLQLKAMFDDNHVVFPILRLRNSVGFISRAVKHKMDKLGIGVHSVFEPDFEQRRRFFREALDLDETMDSLKKQGEDLIGSMHRLADEVDRSLAGASAAYGKRLEKMIARFELKILRATQRKDEDSLRMFREVFDEIFPGGGLQERRETYLTLVERYGTGIIEILHKGLDPFAHEFSFFVE